MNSPLESIRPPTGLHLLSPHILEASSLLKATLRSKEIELGDMKRELEASESDMHSLEEEVEVVLEGEVGWAEGVLMSS